MSARLHAALEFAVKAHAGQDRDGEMPPPYACHPVEVMLNLRYVGGVLDEDLLITALLHDTVEESTIEVSQISKLFGARVGDLVQELTRIEPSAEELTGLSKDEVYDLRTKRFMAEIKSMSLEAQVIKLADRLSNVLEVKVTRPKTKVKRYMAQTEEILKIIPRKRNPALWDAVKAELG